MEKISGKIQKYSKEESRLFAFLGVFLTFIGYIVIRLIRSEDDYAMFYAKQGLILGVGFIFVWIVSMFIEFTIGKVPFIGIIISSLVSFGLNVILLVLWIIGLVYSLSGEKKYVPVVSQIMEKF